MLLVLRFTSLGMYSAVSWHQPPGFRIAGQQFRRHHPSVLCVSAACTRWRGGHRGHLPVSTRRTHNNIGLNLELDAILAVALGGNSLGGGRFNLAGSIIGAYTIQAITTTMYALGVAKAQAPVYKAIIVILIVVVQSPAVKAYFAHRKAQKESLAIAGRS
jgi:simple sugar transport system permease protein